MFVLWYNITQKLDLLINLVYHANKNRCVKDVTDMHFLFNKKETFDEDINTWDTSSVVDMYETFSYATTFNGNLGNWGEYVVLCLCCKSYTFSSFAMSLNENIIIISAL